MPDDTPHADRALRDERSLRLQAEERGAELARQAEVWRTRAEERASRINKLEQEREAHWLARAARALRRRPAHRTPPRPTDTTEQHHPARPRYPQVAMVAIGTPTDLAPMLEQFRLSVAVSARALADADIVVVDQAAVASLDPGARSVLEEWASQELRAPLVVWSADATAPPSDVTRHADAAITTDPSQPADGPVWTPWIPTFDAARHNPSMRLQTEASPDTSTLRSQLRALQCLEDAAGPKRDLIERAAGGHLGGAGTASPGDVLGRRIAYRHHAPWTRASQLLQLVSVDAPSPSDRVAAIVMSNRPNDLTACVTRILGSQHVDLELVIGLHGIELTERLQEVLATASVPFTIVHVSSFATLGEGLNRCIEATSAPVLAKIDDDDHYGPAYLEDALQALAYSGADLVAKGSQFTYLESMDKTVLRRPGVEECILKGTPTGASWVFRRSLWEAVPFPHRPRRVDYVMLEGARTIGATVYATSRWEFCYVRRQHGHTWDASDATFMAGAEHMWDGFHPERMEVSDAIAHE